MSFLSQLQIWDTAGQERFRSITQSYYRSANALILTYDITCEDSFRCLPEWLREIEQYANNEVVTILVGKNALDVVTHKGREPVWGNQSKFGLVVLLCS